MVVVVVDVPVVGCDLVCVVSVPAGGVAFGFTTVSVGCTLVAGTTDVARPVDGTGFDAVASAGVGDAWDPTGTVLDSTEFGSPAGKFPM